MSATAEVYLSAGNAPIVMERARLRGEKAKEKFKRVNLAAVRLSHLAGLRSV